MRLRVLAGLAFILLEAERANDERQSQALADERREDHRERQEEDEVATGKGRTASVSSGRASAAARDTAPRMPAQERKTAPRQFDIRRAIFFGA